jgi:hypothetical protein
MVERLLHGELRQAKLGHQSGQLQPQQIENGRSASSLRRMHPIVPSRLNLNFPAFLYKKIENPT